MVAGDTCPPVRPAVPVSFHLAEAFALSVHAGPWGYTHTSRTALAPGSLVCGWTPGFSIRVQEWVGMAFHLAVMKTF